MAADLSVNFNLLHRTCKLVVLLCLLHISVTVVFYIRSLDNPFAFAQNQQSQYNVSQPDHFTHYRPQTEPVEAQVDGLTEVQQPEAEPSEQQREEKLEKCPETSPLLGKADFLSFTTSVTPQGYSQSGCRCCGHDGHLNASTGPKEQVSTSWHGLTPDTMTTSQTLETVLSEPQLVTVTLSGDSHRNFGHSHCNSGDCHRRHSYGDSHQSRSNCNCNCGDSHVTLVTVTVTVATVRLQQM